MTQDNIQPFEIRRYLAILQKRKYIALSVGLAVLSLFTWSSFFLPEIYEAGTTVSIENDSVLKPLIQGAMASGVQDSLKNLRLEITSRNIVEKAVKKLGMDANVGDSQQYDALIERVRNNINVTVRGERVTNSFDMSYKGKDPKTVVDVINTVASVYIDERMHSRKTDAKDAHEIIQSQLQEYKNKLEESDGAIRGFRERNPKLTATQSETSLLNRLENLQSSEIDADIKIKELVAKKDNLMKQLSGARITVASSSGEVSPQARLNNLNSQLILLLSKYTENHPDVIKTKNEIEGLKKQVSQAKDRMEGSDSETANLTPDYQHLNEELSGTVAEIESLRARTKELSRQQQEVQRTFGSMPKEQEVWIKLQRDRNAYQHIYDQLLQKLQNASEELEITDKGTTFRILNPATLPSFPVKPDRIKMILLGIFLGIVGGIIAVFGLEYFDHSFKDEDSIEASLKQPVLATIPRIVTEADELSVKRLDRKVFTAAGAYLFVIGLVLVKEFLSRHMGIRLINF